MKEYLYNLWIQKKAEFKEKWPDILIHIQIIVFTVLFWIIKYVYRFSKIAFKILRYISIKLGIITIFILARVLYVVFSLLIGIWHNFAIFFIWYGQYYIWSWKVSVIILIYIAKGLTITLIWVLEKISEIIELFYYILLEFVFHFLDTYIFEVIAVYDFVTGTYKITSFLIKLAWRFSKKTRPVIKRYLRVRWYEFKEISKQRIKDRIDLEISWYTHLENWPHILLDLEYRIYLVIFTLVFMFLGSIVAIIVLYTFF